MAAGIDQQAAGQQQRTGAAGGDQDAFGVDVQPVVAAVEAADRLAQGGQATCGGVAGMAGGQCGLAGTHDRFGGGEVRFADFQVDHVVAGLFQRLRAGQQGHHVEGGDIVAAPAVSRSLVVIQKAHAAHGTPVTNGRLVHCHAYAQTGGSRKPLQSCPRSLTS